jgi:hypothetical protein
MRTASFPAKKLARQLRAAERANPNAYDKESEASMLISARAQRTKIKRRAKK